MGADTRVREQIREFEVAAERTAQATAAYTPAARPLPQQLRQSMRREDTESVLSETTDRDVVSARAWSGDYICAEMWESGSEVNAPERESVSRTRRGLVCQRRCARQGATDQA